MWDKTEPRAVLQTGGAGKLCGKSNTRILPVFLPLVKWRMMP